jgi:SPP1 family predicted phage head-tail adaptor
MLQAGSLDRRVLIEQHVEGQDELGQPIDTWVAVATVWANVLLLTGKETLLADADVASATASIRIRYRTDIDSGMRASLLKMVDGAPVVEAIFDILKPLPDYAGREYTDLPCTTGLNNG